MKTFKFLLKASFYSAMAFLVYHATEETARLLSSHYPIALEPWKFVKSNPFLTSAFTVPAFFLKRKFIVRAVMVYSSLIPWVCCAVSIGCQLFCGDLSNWLFPFLWLGADLLVHFIVHRFDYLWINFIE